MEDVIEQISDEEFRLKGRNDRIVKIKEKRISLVELETKLKEHPFVNDCYCFKYDEVLACIVATNDINLNDKTLKEYLSKYSEVVPKKWRFLDEIPKTITGKIDKSFIEHIFNLNLSYPFVVSRQLKENEAVLELIFKKKSNFFKGHFAVMPILPGVVQLFYANWFAQNVFQVDISKQEAKKVKFTNIIHADTNVVLKLKNTEKNVEYSYVIDDKVYSSGLFVKEDKNEI
jgi:3-hydroxymyristoyl/3-hydroxydecanoyl-(acyl carrier protein) dehydratase